MSELSQYNDDGNVLTHGGLANRKKRGRNPLDYQDKNKVREISLLFAGALSSWIYFSSEPAPSSAQLKPAQMTPCLRHPGKLKILFFNTKGISNMVSRILLDLTKPDQCNSTRYTPLPH